MSISIIIPCHNKDYIFLEPLILYINKFFIDKPTCISIGISGITDEQLSYIRKIPSEIPVQITYTGEKQTAGQNRNQAIKKVNTEYILLIDSDDIPNPNLITVYKKFIESNTCNLVVSNFDYNPETIDFRKNWIKVNETKYILNKTTNSIINKKEYNCDFPVHHGSGLLIKRRIFNKTKYSNRQYGEDTEFCMNILKFFGNVFALDINAVAYIQDDFLLKKHYNNLLGFSIF